MLSFRPKKTTLAMQGWSMLQLQDWQTGVGPELSANEETARAVFAAEACRRLNHYRSEATGLRTGDADCALLQVR